MYNSYDCEQINMERQRLTNRLTELEVKQDKLYKSDLALGLIGILFIVMIPTLIDFLNFVKSFQITFFCIGVGLISFLIGKDNREKILKEYSNHLDVIFYKISECEIGNLNLSDILKYPVAHTSFGRLN